MSDDRLKGQQAIPIKVTSTSAVVAEPTNLLGFLLKHDGINDPTFTVYDDAAAATAGREIFGGTWTDSDRPLGFMGTRIRFQRGIYVTIANIGSGYFTFFYNTHYVLVKGA